MVEATISGHSGRKYSESTINGHGRVWRCLNCGYVFRRPQLALVLGWAEDVYSAAVVRPLCPKCGSDAVTSLRAEGR